ncbi:MAG: type II toxin-antitoxin system YoeB family toxin [Balneolaceae bacterium]|nr:type II toxin-antitoxin system YoeB family toxin [Balneolaceae bacterium]
MLSAFCLYSPANGVLGRVILIDATGVQTSLRVYSRRIKIQHRLVYQVYEKKKVVKVIRMWTHSDY